MPPHAVGARSRAQAPAEVREVDKLRYGAPVLEDEGEVVVSLVVVCVDEDGLGVVGGVAGADEGEEEVAAAGVGVQVGEVGIGFLDG